MIHLILNGSQAGPYSIEQVNAMLAAGQIRSSDLAWWEGAPDWMPVIKASGVVVPNQPGVVQNPSSVPVRGGMAAPAMATVAPSVYAPPQSTLLPGATAAGKVSAGTVQALRETRPWVLFLAILGAILTGLMLLGGLGMLLGGAAMGSSAGMGSAGVGLFAAMGIAYLVFAVLYLYPIIKLFKYSSAISRLSRSGLVADLEDALRQQKSFWKFLGIVTLVVICIYIAVIVIAGVGGAASAFSSRP